jgi:hypothetical protein
MENICNDIFYTIENKIVDEAFIEIKKKGVKIDTVLLIGGSSRIPKIKDILEHRLNSIDRSWAYDTILVPEEAVVIGCAIKAALSTHKKDVIDSQVNNFSSCQLYVRSASQDIKIEHEEWPCYLPNKFQFEIKQDIGKGSKLQVWMVIRKIFPARFVTMNKNFFASFSPNTFLPSHTVVPPDERYFLGRWMPVTKKFYMAKFCGKELQ